MLLQELGCQSNKHDGKYTALLKQMGVGKKKCFSMPNASRGNHIWESNMEGQFKEGRGEGPGRVVPICTSSWLHALLPSPEGLCGLDAIHRLIQTATLSGKWNGIFQGYLSGVLSGHPLGAFKNVCLMTNFTDLVLLSFNPSANTTRDTYIQITESGTWQNSLRANMTSFPNKHRGSACPSLVDIFYEVKTATVFPCATGIE